MTEFAAPPLSLERGEYLAVMERQGRPEVVHNVSMTFVVAVIYLVLAVGDELTEGVQLQRHTADNENTPSVALDFQIKHHKYLLVYTCNTY